MHSRNSLKARSTRALRRLTTTTKRGVCDREQPVGAIGLFHSAYLLVHTSQGSGSFGSFDGVSLVN